jgi:uncharacterized protein (TIGR03546 family)
MDNDNPKQIALGVSLGMLLGLAPTNLLYLLMIVFCVSIFKINVSGAFLGALIFGLLSFAFDPISNQIGIMLLITNKGLLPFWTMLYNLPIVPWLNFNNTLMLGSIVLGLILFIPVYFGSINLLAYFRTHLKEKLANSKLVKSLKASSLFKWIFKLQEIAG